MKENCSTPQEPNLCSYFKQNRCQFGISGKGCKFSHPKMCQKLLSHGKSSYRGCTKEEKCSYFHPRMCRNSLSKRLCTNLDCQFMHIKGTKRYQSSPVEDARNILNRNAKAQSTKEEIMKDKSRPHNSSPGMDSGKKQDQAKSDPFLVQSQPTPKPPIGNGCGGDGHQELMKVLQQMILMQSQQLQILQHLQMPHQLTLQSQLPTLQQRIPHM